MGTRWIPIVALLAVGILAPLWFLGCTPSVASAVLQYPFHNLIRGCTPSVASAGMDAADEALPEKRITNSFGMAFLWIPPGTFMMGSPEHEPGRRENEKQHRVTLTKGYYMQTTEVTEDQWKEIWGSMDNAGYGRCGNCPVVDVAWYTVKRFIEKLNQRDKSNNYRLPTEAEWEYAARAGSTTRYAFGDDDGQLDAYAWYGANSKRTPHPRGRKEPNAWGLYDVHGNIYEWCQDWYGDYPSGSVTNPAGPATGTHKVFRGGSWDDRDPNRLRSAYRSRSSGSFNAIGFRLVRIPYQLTGLGR